MAVISQKAIDYYGEGTARWMYAIEILKNAHMWLGQIKYYDRITRAVNSRILGSELLDEDEWLDLLYEEMLLAGVPGEFIPSGATDSLAGDGLWWGTHDSDR